MNKRELIQDIRAFTGCGGFISRAKIAHYMGMSRNAEEVDRFTKGCDFIENGRGRQFSLMDVADNIMKSIAQR